MNFLKIFLASFLGIIIGGCSSNYEVEEILSNKSKQNTIGFTLVNTLQSTRSTNINSSNLTSTGFEVWAIDNNKQFFMGDSVKQANQPNLGGIYIIYDNINSWVYYDKNQIYYWPTNNTTLDFYAIDPIKQTSTYSWTITNNNKQINYITIDEYGETNVTGDENTDVMYAVKLDQTYNSNNGKVKLKFQHILSNLTFKATTETPNMEVYLNDIKLHNTFSTGTFNIPESENKPNNTNWSIDSTYNISLTILKDKNFHITYDTILPLNLKEPTFIIPQTLTKWDATTTAITKADISQQSYLEINCKILQNKIYLFGSENEFGTLYIPFGEEFNPGLRYNYTIRFGGGYDENGNPILKPIIFDAAEVYDWDDIDIY